MEQTGIYVKILQESLERKKKYLEDILTLTKEQERIAGEKKFDENSFGEVIEKKEKLINNINEIDKGFSSVYDRVRIEIINNKDVYNQELKKIQQLIRECVDFGTRIEVLEERNKAVLERCFASGLKGIRQVKQSKKVANSYYKSMSNGYVDDSLLYDKKK